MKNIHTLLTSYEVTDEVADKLRNSGYNIICIQYGYQNFCDLILYFSKEKKVKYYTVSQFVDERLRVKKFLNISSLDGFIKKHIGSVKNFRLIESSCTSADYLVEVETFQCIDTIMVSVEYEVDYE